MTPGPDRITLTGIRARGTHGVLASEKRDGQEFVVDVVLEVDVAGAGRTDDLARTVNYAEVAADVVARIEGPSLDLIEALTEQVAADALTRPRVEAVEVTVHKPHAPVGVPFGDVTVHVRRERDVHVVVAIGSNLEHTAPEPRRPGAPLVTMRPAHAVAVALAELAEVGEVVAVADPVTTDPVGGPEQPPYTNSVAVLRTHHGPYEVLRRLHAIEARHGRTRQVRWGARTLDLDLIQYGDPGPATWTKTEVASEEGTQAATDVPATDVVLDDPELTLPHPRAHERAFVLVPWAQADPTARLRLPDGSVAAVRDLLTDLDTSGVRP